MSTISNDAQLRAALDGLELAQQRALAARFVDNVLALNDDPRLHTAIAAASGDGDLQSAFKGAKAATLEAHARCGADGEWNDQAGYFVARAAEAATAAQVRSHGKNPAWQAALSCRMARTAAAEQTDEDAHDSESQAQYRIAQEFLTR